MTRKKNYPDVDPPESVEVAYERGVVEERARWEARLERLRKDLWCFYAATDLEMGRAEAMARAIAIMEGREP